MAIAVAVVETNPNRLRLLITEDNDQAGATPVAISSAVLRAAINAAPPGVAGSRLKDLLDTPVSSDAEAARVLGGIQNAGAPNLAHVIRAHCHVTPRTGLGRWEMAEVNSGGFPGLSLRTPGSIASAYLDVVLEHTHHALS